MVTDTTTKDGSSGDLLDDDLLEDVPDEGDTGRERISRRPPLPEGMKPGPRKKLRYAKKGGAPVLQPGGERGDALLSTGANGGAPSLQQGQGPDIHGHQGMQGDDRVARGRDKANTVVPAHHESPDDVLCDDADSSRRDRAGGTVDAPEDPAPLHTQDPGTAHDGNLSGNDETPVDPTPPGQQKKTLRPLRPGSGSSSKRVNPAPRAVPGQVDVLLLEDELLDEDGIPGRQGGKRANHAPDATFVEDDLPNGDTASSPDTRGLFGGFGSRNGKRTASTALIPSNGKKPGLLSGLTGIFSKKVKGQMQSIPFHVGPLDEPSLEGALRDVNVTYPVNAPFQYVHIEYHNGEGALRYEVREPQLSEDEQFALRIVEQGFEKMISTNLDMIAGGDRVAYLKDRFLSIVLIFGIQATEEQKERMFFHLCKKYLGYSHMDTLMMDKYIEDISCNGSEINLYVMHRIYGSVQTDVQFREVELNNFVLRLAQIGGRHISLLQPIRDVTLPDGSRANLTLGSEVTKKGSTFTIRKFRTNPISPIEMMEYGTIDAQQLAYLWLLMEYKRSILVSGGTATGKTTMLNVLCSFIPSEYKIVSIEDTAELNLLHPNWIQSVTRTGFGGGESSAANLSGVSGISRRSPGDISLYDLLVAALRQRPEFIIVGEVRGEEAFTLFQAIAVGHAALGTIHAGSINELLARIESNPMRVPRALFSNLDAVIFPMHIMRGERSARRVANITEVLELDRDTGDLITNTSFKWVPDRDEFRFQGRTYLFDKIKDTYGISTDTLRSELEHRIQFLEWLQKKGVKDYHLVTRMIRHYQRNRDLVIDRIRENGEVADLLEAEGSSYNPLKAIGEESGNTELMED